MKTHLFMLAALSVNASPISAADAPRAWLWRDSKPHAHLIAARLPDPTSNLIDRNINGRLAEWFGWSLPSAARADKPGLYLLVGNPANHPQIRRLVDAGLSLDLADAGDEGFRLLTHETGGKRFVIVAANTPVGLKHGCQELLFYHLSATTDGGWIDWPIDVMKKPAFAYRGVYMLPCWSAYDSLESWKRVLEFHSELTLNRNWFWLAGFPLLKQYGGEYAGTDLADPWNVTGLIDLCRSEGMKFYIGGGWYTWHHEKIANGDIERGIKYYQDMLALLPETEGIYLEPPGEGWDVDEATHAKQVEALQRLTASIWRDRPEFEFALAIGKFNAPDYRRAMHLLDPRLESADPTGPGRVYWWWCWGDPLRDKALDEHALILRWHTIVRMSEYHGANAAPRPEETALTGFATSYDPGQGFGNPWNGWGKLGVDHPRNLHPHTMPFFSHQYLFRERCWDVTLSQEAFEKRLARRLFDADVPGDAISHYLKLADFCPKPTEADPHELEVIRAFVDAHHDNGTPRHRDTFARMREALEGIVEQRAKAATQASP